MARNMYGATSADFTLTSGGRPVPGAELTIWDARTGGTQITDLLDVDSVACTTVTSDAAGAVVYYGPDSDKTVHWADSGQGARVAIRPVDITGDPPVISVGTVTTGTAGATLTGTSEAPVLNLVLPSAGANGVNTAAIQDSAVTSAKIAADTITAANIASNAVGSSELADNAVDTAAIADGSVTAAKLSAGLGGLLTAKGDLVARDASTAVRLPVGADGTVLQADAGSAAGVRWGAEPAAKASIGNLLTANQAKPTSTGAYVVFNATEGAAGVFTLTSGEAIARALDIPVTGGATYTLIATATVPDRYVRTMVLWKDSGGNAIGSIAGSGNPYDFPVSGSGTVTITLVAPANAVTADFYPFYTSAGAGGDSLTVTRASFHRGAGGTWQMPGVPIPGQSRIAVNNAVDLSGTGAPEGVIAAAPGSTYLQTDATNDVKGWIKWVKATGTGNTGWVAGPEADTGRRTVLSYSSGGVLTENGVTTSTSAWGPYTGTPVTFELRRIAHKVSFSLTGPIVKLNGYDTGPLISGLPVGWRINPTIGNNWVVPFDGTQRLLNGSLTGIGRGSGTWATNDLVLAFTLEWSTADDWPSSLPGAAA